MLCVGGVVSSHGSVVLSVGGVVSSHGDVV